MVYLDYKYLEHVLKCLRKDVSKEVRIKTTNQLEDIINKEKTKIKTEESNGRIKPIG